MGYSKNRPFVKVDVTGEVDKRFDEVTSRLAEKATKTDVANISNGTPLFANTIGEMTDTTRAYVLLTDGYIYLYNSDTSTFEISSKQYQSTGIGDKTITPEKTTFIQISENIFNKNSASNVEGYYITSVGGIVEYASLFYTHHVDVKPNEKYIILRSPQVGDNSSGGYYDSLGSFISSVTGLSSTDGLYRIITVPDNADIKTMRINYELSKIDSMMIIKDTVYPSSYIPYSVSLSGEISVVADNVKGFSNNLLYGKTALFDGDSICAGNGWVGYELNSGWAKVIGEDNNMSWVNYGVGGGTITAEMYRSDGTTPRHWVSRNIANMQSTADYIILQGGINDYWLNAPIGTITSDYASVLDDTTFCGAFESMLKQAQLKWKGKKLGFIITYKIYGSYFPYGSTSSYAQDYFDKAREICEKWSVPYIDLFKESGLNGALDEINNLYFANDGSGGDYAHPTEAGYRDFLAPKIEAWMRTL